MSSPLFSQLTRRPACDEDAAFLCRLYAAGRAEEMVLFPWTDTQKELFLEQQFRAQQAHYHAHFADASCDLLLLGGLPMGQMSVIRRPSEIHLVEVGLLTEYRNQGLGTDLLHELIQDADMAGIPIRLHVAPYNPAARLYARLGFQPVSSDSVYTLMEYLPFCLRS